MRPSRADLAGVDQGMLDSVVAQDGQNSVGRQPLRDAVESDAHSRPRQPNALGRYLHVLPADEAAGPLDIRLLRQRRPLVRLEIHVPKRLDGCVEGPAGTMGHLRRISQGRHQKLVGIFQHAPAIEPNELALGAVEAHHSLDAIQFRESGLRRAPGRSPAWRARPTRTRFAPNAHPSRRASCRPFIRLSHAHQASPAAPAAQPRNFLLLTRIICGPCTTGLEASLQESPSDSNIIRHRVVH